MDQVCKQRKKGNIADIFIYSVKVLKVPLLWNKRYLLLSTTLSPIINTVPENFEIKQAPEALIRGNMAIKKTYERMKIELKETYLCNRGVATDGGGGVFV